MIRLNRVVFLLVAGFLVVACGGEDKQNQRATVEESSRTPGVFAPPTDLSVILISIDTCRPDYFGCYGNEEIETPVIDRLAARGMRFANTAASIPVTLPSHSSIMTAMEPYQHRVRNNGNYRLADSRVTLAEKFEEDGYATAAILGAVPLDSRYGLAQGFELYDDEFPPTKVGDGDAVSERTADDVVSRAIDWLSRHKKEKRFLFLHFFDPHWTYSPPEPFRTDYATDLYGGEIAFVDSELGRLMEALDEFKMMERTLIVLTGDHGESLGEHEEVTHSIFVYKSTIDIPLIVHWPDMPEFASIRRGSSVESLVRSVDIGPTIAELAGLPPFEEGAGRSLVELLTNPGDDLGLVHYAESFVPRESYGWSEVRAITAGGWKYIQAPREELYNLATDPGELKNIAGENRPKVEELKMLLEERLTEDRARRAESELITIDDESRAQLEALGYVTRASTGDHLDSENLPDPKDLIASLVAFYDAKAMVEGSKVEEGLSILRELLAEDADNPEILKLIATTEVNRGNLGAAEEALRAAYAVSAHDLMIQSNLAYLQILHGRYDAAEELIGGVLKSDPRFEGGWTRLGDCRLRQGDTSQAIEFYQKELENYPTSPGALNALGMAYGTLGRDAEALKYFRMALEARDDFAEVYYNIGNYYEKKGNVEQAVAHFRKAIEYNPDLVEAYYNLAMKAKALGRYPEAMNLLQQAAQKKPSFAKAHYALGNLYRESGRLNEAVLKYREALGYDDRDPDVYLNLGVAFAAMNRLPDAIDAWEMAARVAPQSASGQTALKNAQIARAQMGGIR